MSFIWAGVSGRRWHLPGIRRSDVCGRTTAEVKKKKNGVNLRVTSVLGQTTVVCAAYTDQSAGIWQVTWTLKFTEGTHTLTHTQTHGYRTNTRSSSSPQALHGRWLHKHRHRTDDITDPQQPVNKAPPADRAEASGATLKSNSSRWETAPRLWWMELKWT